MIYGDALSNIHELAELREKLTKCREEYNLVVMSGGNVENVDIALDAIQAEGEELFKAIAEVRSWLTANGVWHV